MRLPKTSRRYTSETEELTVGKGDYMIGGARSPAFLDLDGARHRRPVIFGEVPDTLEGYPESAASMFSGRQNDIEEWSVMWKELGADGICLKMREGTDPGLIGRIAARTRIPVMVFGPTGTLIQAASDITDTILILGCTGREQSLEVSCGSNNHIVIADCSGCDPAELCGEMKSNGAKNIMVNLGAGSMSPGLGELRSRMSSYRMRGLDGEEECGHTIMCDVTRTWDSSDNDVSARAASMREAAVALSVMMSGADVLVIKGPGAADMARVYGEELADL